MESSVLASSLVEVSLCRGRLAGTIGSGLTFGAGAVALVAAATGGGRAPVLRYNECKPPNLELVGWSAIYLDVAILYHTPLLSTFERVILYTRSRNLPGHIGQDIQILNDCRLNAVDVDCRY